MGKNHKKKGQTMSLAEFRNTPQSVLEERAQARKTERPNHVQEPRPRTNQARHQQNALMAQAGGSEEERAQARLEACSEPRQMTDETRAAAIRAAIYSDR